MTSPVPGWYPDPHGQSGERFWNGGAWTSDTRAVPVAPPPELPPAYDGFGRLAPPPPQGAPSPYGGAPQYGDGPQFAGGPQHGSGQQYGGGQQYGRGPQYGDGPQYGQGPGYTGGRPFTPPVSSPVKDFLARNPLSLATVGVTVAYVLILVFAHIAFLGIVPLILGIRAASRKEPLAVAAVVIGVAALAFGIYEYTRR